MKSAAFLATEAVEITVIVHVERRGLLVVKGAETLVGVAAGGLELNVSLDELDDVDPVSDLLERFRGDSARQSQPLLPDLGPGRGLPRRPAHLLESTLFMGYHNITDFSVILTDYVCVQGVTVS